jgi:hypothetical protein
MNRHDRFGIDLRRLRYLETVRQMDSVAVTPAGVPGRHGLSVRFASIQAGPKTRPFRHGWRQTIGSPAGSQAKNLTAKMAL